MIAWGGQMSVCHSFCLLLTRRAAGIAALLIMSALPFSAGALTFAAGQSQAALAAKCGNKALVEQMPMTGRTFAHLKCPLKPEAGVIHAEKGQVVTAEAYATARAAEVQARYAAHGKLDDGALVLEASCQAGLVKQVPVVVWSALQPQPEAPIAPDIKASSISLKTQIALADSQVSLLGLCAIAKASECKLFEQAPAAAMMVPCQNLKTLAFSPDVARVFANDTQGVAGGNTFPYSVAAIPLFWYGGSAYIGTGNAVCVLEPNAPLAASLPYLPGNVTIRANTLVGTVASQTHAAVCGGVVKSTDSIGIAFGADLFFANYQTSGVTYAGQVQIGTNWCATMNARNWSFSQLATNGDDSVQDALFDYAAKNPPYPLVAALSGDGGVNKKAGHRYIRNGLVVGGANEYGTAIRTDDWIWDGSVNVGSQSMNDQAFPSSDREVPHVVAPAVNLDAVNQFGGTGTSFAAPQVAAAGALIDQIGAANLKYWPEAKRAIIMAGANQNLDYTAVPQDDPSLDGQDGVGEMNVSLAMTIAEPIHQHSMSATPDRYGYDFITVFPFSGYLNNRCVGCGTGNTQGYRIQVPASPTGLRVRVVLTWDGTACGGGAWNQNCSTSSLDADLDLYVCPAGTTDFYSCVRSDSVSNSWEAVQFVGTPGAVYDVFVAASSFSASWTYMGLAWAVDNYLD